MYKKNPKLFKEILNNELIIHIPLTGETTFLNETAKFIFDSIEHKSVQEISQELTSIYDIKIEQALKATISLIEEFVNKQIVLDIDGDDNVLL